MKWACKTHGRENTNAIVKAEGRRPLRRRWRRRQDDIKIVLKEI
jgi:hypothetical protein